MTPIRYFNQYHCPHCGEEWSQLDDETPSQDCHACGTKEIDPNSEDLLDNKEDQD